MRRGMAHVAALPELVLILGVGVVAALLVGFLRLPAVAGFMLAGAFVGPSGMALVKEQHVVDALSEVGVVLLLFTIGLEFSLDRLKRIWRLVAIGGTLQVGLTTLACVGVALFMGESFERGVFFGFLVALSSTAIVLRGLSERGETDAPHGRFIIGALIYQDLCVIPMMLLIPILAGRAEGSPAVGISIALAKATAFVVVTLVAGRFLVPRVLKRVDAAKSREVFLLAVLVFCAGIAILTAMFGLSLALGAFLAGMLLSDSAYGHRAMANVLPLRDLLTSLFFMSLGMLFDVGVVQERPVVVAVVFAAMFFGKGLVATIASIAMRFPARVAWLAGVGLAQFGEFGFILAKEGAAVGLLAPEESRLLLAAGLLTMFVTPLSMRLAPHVAAGAALLRPLERLMGARGIDEVAPEHAGMRGHVIVAGYGLGGQLLSRALAKADVPYLVVALDAESVRLGRAAGEPIYYGDVTSEEALHHAHLQHADALVLMISDADAARQTISIAKQIAPRVPILVRSRRFDEDPGLRRLGADDVVAEELEAGVETIARVLRLKGAPINVLGRLVREARAAAGESARKTVFPRQRLSEIRALDDLKLESFLVDASHAACGRSLADLRLRTSTDALVVAVVRDGAILEGVDPHLPFAAGDVVFLAGRREALHRAVAVLQTGAPDATDENASGPPEPAHEGGTSA